MKSDEFEQVFEARVTRCRQILVDKAKEYANDADRLHNFATSAALNGCTPEQALWGFLTKHIISLADMVQSGEHYEPQVWDEKLGDFLNYGFLLDAVVTESRNSKINRFPVPGSEE